VDEWLAPAPLWRAVRDQSTRGPHVEGTQAPDQQTFEKASNALMGLASDYCGGTAEIVSWPF